MHKKIALLIEKIVDESPYTHITCEVLPNKTGGFWEVILKFEERNDIHSNAMVRLLEHLGWVYGEDLNIEDKGKKVYVN